MKQVLVLRDNFLLVSVDTQEQLELLSEYVTENKERLGVEVLIFGGMDSLGDARDTPPKVTEAAKLVDAWLKEQKGK